MEETFLLDLQEYELTEGRKWKILDQIIDLNYNGNVENFIDKILQHRILNGFYGIGGGKCLGEL
jgi:hypothetical protein